MLTSGPLQVDYWKQACDYAGKAACTFSQSLTKSLHSSLVAHLRSPCIPSSVRMPAAESVFPARMYAFMTKQWAVARTGTLPTTHTSASGKTVLHSSWACSWSGVLASICCVGSCQVLWAVRARQYRLVAGWTSRTPFDARSLASAADRTSSAGRRYALVSGCGFAFSHAEARSDPLGW